MVHKSLNLVNSTREEERALCGIIPSNITLAQTRQIFGLLQGLDKVFDGILMRRKMNFITGGWT
jgi:hypothetical protein